MTDVRSAPLEEMVLRARRYAALTAGFRPKDAFLADGSPDPDLLVDAASALAAACDTDPCATDRWLMRTAERRYELDLLHQAGLLDAEIESRRARGVDEETGDLLDAIQGEGAFSREAIDRRIREPESRRDLERLILALDRAGPVASAYGLLEPARLALYEWDRRARRDHLVEAGFVGRDEERRLLADWIADPVRQPPVRALFLSGLPGIGKSWLLEEAVRAADEQGRDPITIRLDFDRAGLDVRDLVGLTMEVARQVALRVGEGGDTLLRRRLEAASTDAASIGSLKVRDVLPRPLATAIGEVVAKSGREVLVVLDTLEVLRARGGSHPKRLFEWLDRLVEHGLAPIAVVAAGRGDALDECPDRVAGHRHLETLEPAASERLLERLGIDRAVAPVIAGAAEGRPLLLRLAARLVERDGGAFTEAVRQGISGAYLYRFLLSRIVDPDLRRLARSGLILRRISAEIIAEVLAPKVGLGRLSAERAQLLFDLLKAEHWLVEEDREMPGWLNSRADMRREFLPLLYESQERRCARINAAAHRWFAARPEPWCAVEAAYHRLQMMRTDPSIPTLDPKVAAQFDEEMIAELPAPAQDLVRALRGERTGSGRAGAGAEIAFDQGLADELVAVVERSDFGEGRYIVERAIESGLDSLHPAADAVRAFYWRSGRWSEARDWLRRRDQLTGDDGGLAEIAPELRLGRLEMRAEFDFDRLATLLRDQPEHRDFAVEASWRADETHAFSGALAIASLAPDGGGKSDTMLTEVVGAARDYWTGEERRFAGHTRGVQQLTARLSGRLDVGPGDVVGVGEPGIARLFCVDSCFEGFLHNLDRIWRDGALGERAAAVDEAIAAAGGLLPGTLSIGPRPPAADQPIGGLAAMGLLAEWVEAEAFLAPDPDLRLIGRSAALWRRTMSGQWSYGRGRPLFGWPHPPLDATLADRVRILAGAAAPADEARAQLRLWLGVDADARLAELTGRLDRTIHAAARSVPRLRGERTVEPAERADAIAAALVPRRVPAAFVPPFAVLIAHDEL